MHPLNTGLAPIHYPVWNFLFRIKRSSLTYFCGERPISHCTANIWIHPLCQEFQQRFKQIITNAIYIKFLVPCEYRVSTYSLYIFCKKFDLASFSVEPWGLEHSRFNKPYSDVITKTITKSHREHTSCNTLEYSRNTHNVPQCQQCHHVNATVPLRHLQQFTGLNVPCLCYYTMHVASCLLF